MSWPNDFLLFDVLVLVPTLQSATSARQSQLVEDKDHDNQFSLGSIGKKEEEERDNYKSVYNGQLITTESSLAFRLLNFRANAKIHPRQPSKLQYTETRFTFRNCCIL